MPTEEQLKKMAELQAQADARAEALKQPFFKLLTGKIERATEHSAAFDLFYTGHEPILIGDRPTKISTNVRSEFSPGFVAIIKEKSGLAAKGLEVKGGVIDADYRDEWFVVMRKPLQLEYIEDPVKPFIAGGSPHRFNPGDKIAQFIIVALPQLLYKAEEGAFIETKDIKRAGGFGSTGT